MTQPETRILADHKRLKKTLVPPLAGTASWAASFERDGMLPQAVWNSRYLPEFLWLGNLALTGDLNDIAARYNRACDLLDSFIPTRLRRSVFAGYISDFALIGVRKRKAALSKLAADWPDYLGLDMDFRLALRLHPDCPAAWLAADIEAREDTKQRGESRLRELVDLLRDLENNKVLRARIVGLNRLFVHRKLFFDANGIDPTWIDSMARYPDCPKEEKKRVEQLCRIISNLEFNWRNHESWARSFWSQNSRSWSCLT